MGVWGVAVAVALVAACAKQESAAPLPPELSGMKLVRVTTGQGAAAMIARLHGKDVAPAESHIGYYGGGAMQAVLYVSRFASDEEARSQLAAMSDRIGAGSSGFGHHAQFTIDAREIHLVLGQGQVHYFFTEGSDLSWLAMRPDLARAGLAELLDVELERVPSLEQLLVGVG